MEGFFPVKIRRSRLGKGLLLYDGKLCCLGHICHAFGIPLAQLDRVGCLWQLPQRYWGNLPEGLRPYRDSSREEHSSALEAEIMRINDDANLSTEDREFHLSLLAASVGIELIFEGEYRGEKEGHH